VFISALFLDDYLRRIELDGAEVYALMLMSASGGVLMASANDLIVLFLGLRGAVPRACTSWRPASSGASRARSRG
jgi:NADH:ubiquinone oxidoreductase subunit 2 (subunit N)